MIRQVDLVFPTRLETSKGTGVGTTAIILLLFVLLWNTMLKATQIKPE